MSAIDAYKIAVSLAFESDVSEGIRALMPGLEALDAALTHANEQAGGLSKSLRGIGGAAAGINRATDALRNLHSAMESVNQATDAHRSGGGMSGYSAEPGGTTMPMGAGAGPRIAHEPYVPNFVMLSGGQLVPYQGPRDYAPHGVSMLPNFTTGGGGQHDEPFLAPGEGGPIRLNPNGRRGGAQAAHGSVQDIFALTLGTGVAAEALKHILGPAIDLDQSAALLAADTRLTPEQVRAAVERATDTAKQVPGSTASGNMRALLDLKTVFGSLDEAESMLPGFAHLATTLQMISRQHGGRGDQEFAAAKAMEIMGGLTHEEVGPNGETLRTLDPERGMGYLNRMQQVAIATGGRVMPSDYLALAKNARVAGMKLTDEFVYEKLPAIMQTEGASRTGTALMSMAQVFDGGKLTDKSMGALIGLGLASPDGLERVGGHRNRRGDMVGGRMAVHADQIYDHDLMLHDPLEWIEAAQKRMDAHGIHGTEAQINSLMSASQRSPIAGILAVLLKDMPAILKEQANIRNTDPKAVGLTDESGAAAVQRMQAALHNMLTELGSATLGDAVKGMDAVTAALNAIGEFAHNHPESTKAALEGMAAGIALFGVSTAAGAAMKLLTGPAGFVALAVGIEALGGSMKAIPQWLADSLAGGVIGYRYGGAVGAAIGAVGAPATHGMFNDLGKLGGAIGNQDWNPLHGDFWTGSQRQWDGVLGTGAAGGNGQPAVRLQSYHPAQQAPMVEHITYIHLDGRQVAKSVTRHQAQMVGQQQYGTIRPDPSAHPQYAGHLVET